jgi:conjugative transfer pilus assembly protein TraH
VHKTKEAFRRLTALAITCTFAGNSTAMSMQELFDEVNSHGNVSTASVVQGQTMNMLSGGSMFMRMPNRTYNVANFTPPSYATGCGGIDLFAGGFSFINKEQFVAMLRNIGSNALGYGFKLAIQNLCPTCDNVIQALQATAQTMNRLNLDSCQAAKGIVNATVPDSWEKDKTNTAKMFGVDGNYFADVTDAWTNVANSLTKTNEQIQKAAADKPQLKDTLPTGNVTWKALKKLDGLTDDYRMLIMSMVGTTIFPTEREAGPVILARKEITVQALIGGNVVRTDNGLPMGKINLPIWRCIDMDECLTVTESTLETDSFRHMIRTEMNKIIDNLANRKAYDNPTAIMRFLNTTDIPVYKLLAVSTSLYNTSMADHLVSRYQELIAAKYAEVYIQRAATDIQAAVAKYKAQAPMSQTSELEKYGPQLEALSREARQILTTAYTQTVSTYNIAQEVGYMERAFTANLSGTLRQSLAYGKSLN